MSAERRLTAGLYGKHPGFGDFIGAGLPEPVIETVGQWTQGVLGEWRDWIGADWQAAFDASPRVAFWIGPALVDGQPLRGVWMPSWDRSGRRFPLAILQKGGVAPVMAPADSFYAVADLALTNLATTDSFDPRAVADRLQQELPPGSNDVDGMWPTFWALNPDRSVDELLSELRDTDHERATATRSYWWFAQDGALPAGVLACQGWPAANELAWLFARGQMPAATTDNGDEP